MKNDTPNKMAAAFARLLKIELQGNLNELQEIDRQNAIEASHGSNVCHSHDYCDANVVMAAAFEEVTGKPFTVTGTDIVDFHLFNLAWSIAKGQGFAVLAADPEAPRKRLIRQYCGTYLEGRGECGESGIQCSECKAENLTMTDEEIKRAGFHPSHYPFAR